MGVENVNIENAQEEDNAGGVVGFTNLKLFIEEKLEQRELDQLQKQYASNASFQNKIDNMYCGSDLESRLQKKGCEAYTFLSQAFVQNENEILPPQNKKDIWQKIQNKMNKR